MAMVPFQQGSNVATASVGVLIAALQVPRDALLVVENTGPDAATFELRMSKDGSQFETYGPTALDLAGVAAGDQRTVYVPRNRLEYLQVRAISLGTTSVVAAALYNAPSAVGPVNGRP